MNIQRSRGRTILRMSSSLNWKSPGTYAGMGAGQDIKFAGIRKTRVVSASMDMRGLLRIILMLCRAARRLSQMHL